VPAKPTWMFTLLHDVTNSVLSERYVTHFMMTSKGNHPKTFQWQKGSINHQNYQLWGPSWWNIGTSQHWYVTNVCNHTGEKSNHESKQQEFSTAKNTKHVGHCMYLAITGWLCVQIIAWVKLGSPEIKAKSILWNSAYHLEPLWRDNHVC